jgi:hypothetical protein
MQVALGQHVAHQALVLQFRNEIIGHLPLGLGLDLEDLLVERGIRVREDRRQLMGLRLGNGERREQRGLGLGNQCERRDPGLGLRIDRGGGLGVVASRRRRGKLLAVGRDQIGGAERDADPGGDHDHTAEQTQHRAAPRNSHGAVLSSLPANISLRDINYINYL